MIASGRPGGTEQPKGEARGSASRIRPCPPRAPGRTDRPHGESATSRRPRRNASGSGASQSGRRMEERGRSTRAIRAEDPDRPRTFPGAESGSGGERSPALRLHRCSRSPCRRRDGSGPARADLPKRGRVRATKRRDRTPRERPATAAVLPGSGRQLECAREGSVSRPESAPSDGSRPGRPRALRPRVPLRA